MILRINKQQPSKWQDKQRLSKQRQLNKQCNQQHLSEHGTLRNGDKTWS
jgi:hypothetical protein